MMKMMLAILIALPISAALSGQGLFESSLPEGTDAAGRESLSIGGFIRSAAYLGETAEKSELYLQSVYAQASIQLKVKAGKNISAFTDLRFRYGSEWQEPISQMELREAYVDLQTGPVGFRFGKQISPWGKGSFYNPVNKITPMNPTTRSPEPDDMNLGTWALQANAGLGPYLKLAASWTPLYQPGILLIDPMPMPGYVHFLDPEYPGVRLEESSYGIHLDLHAPLLDAALYWFDGYHIWPGIAFDSFILDPISMAPGELNLYEKAYRIMMAGMDFSLPLGSWLLTAEAAWVSAKEDHGTLEFIPFPELSYTAEIEHNGRWLTVLAGYYGKYILDFIPARGKAELAADLEPYIPLMEGGLLSPELLSEGVGQQVSAFNRLYNYQLEEFYHSGFLVMRGDFFHNQMEIELPLLYNFTSEEWNIRPAIAWMPADGLRVKAGYSGFRGSKNSLYDLVGPVLNAGFLTVTLTF